MTPITFYYCIFAMLALIVLAVVITLVVVLRAIIKNRKFENGAVKAVVVAKWGSDFVVRDEKGKLYYLSFGYAKNIKVGDEIKIEPIPNCWPNGERRLNVATSPYYIVSTEKTAAKAKVARRLNKDVVFCRLGDREIFVNCSLENQLKYQSAVSMVVGIRSDGNDRQVIKCQDVIELPVCETDGVFALQECRQV